MTMRKLLLIFLFIFGFPFILFANEFTKESDIELKNLTVKTNITGQVAQTEIILELFNPNSRVYEYTLNFPLNHSQMVVGFALDINNVFVDAVPVEKPKAESVFEDVVRRNIDPALLSKTSGDNYKIRVYPINPYSSRKVKITLFQFLNAVEDQYSYILNSIGKFEKADSVNIITVVSEQLPVSSESCIGTLNYGYERNTHSYVSYSHDENVLLKQNILKINIPNTQEDYLSMYKYDNVNYFLFQTEYEPQNTIIPDFESTPILLLWDASLSEEENKKNNISFLSNFFKQNKNTTVSLVVFRNKPENAIEFSIKDGNWTDLKKYIENIVYDGSASYDFMKNLKSYKNAILFSDGNDMFSKNEDIFISADNIFCICSVMGSNTKRLEKLISTSKGNIITIENDNFDFNKIKLEIVKTPAISDAKNADEVFTELKGKTLIIVGIINNKGHNVSISLNNGNEIVFSPENCFIINSLPKIWASYKIDSLLYNKIIHKSEISRISKKFSVPSDTTSLLVLENAQDYSRYGIEPPEIFKEEYDKLQKSKEIQQENALSNFKQEWNRYIKWWQTDFPKDEPVLNKKEKEFPTPVNGLYDNDIVFLPELSRSYEAMPDEFNEFVYEDEATENETSESNIIIQDESESVGKIYLQKWNSNDEISERIRNSEENMAYDIYLDAREDFKQSAGFYLECSELLAEKGLKEKAIRVLSTLAEISGEDRSVLRLLANKLTQMEQYEIAEKIYRQILEISPYEAQSYLDLGKCLHELGKNQEAIEIMYKVITLPDLRFFPGITLITMKEINSIIHTTDNLDISFIDPYFIADLPLDLRIVLSWDTDNTDIDLHVIDPNNEETYYSHKLSYQGGLNSDDNTSGFGPEDYSLKTAKKGIYRVEVNFYGNYQQKISDKTHVYLDFYTNWGTLRQQKKSVILELKNQGNRIYASEIEIF